MTQQFIRACSLVVGDASGSGIDLANLRITFNITHGTTETPRILSARVYNPAPKTVSRIRDEFVSITLSAGYQGNIASIFSGTIQQVRSGRENPVDTFVDIFATTGDQAYSTAVSNQVLGAGWTHQLAFERHAEDMAAYNVAAGAFPEISGSGARPKVIYGMTRDACRVTAQSAGAFWGINDSSLDFTSIASVSMGDAETEVILSPRTGLVGIPVQTIDGVQAACLLNPRIKMGSRVRIDPQYIIGAQADLSSSGIDGGNKDITSSSGVTRQSVFGISPTGSYFVAFCEHSGDTKGDEWYTRIACQAVDVSIVSSAAKINAVD